MTQHTKTAFSRAGEVLEHAIGYLARVGDLLDEARGQEHPDRVRMLLDAFELEHRNLLGALERYADDAPAKVLDTFVQFSAEVPESLAGPEAPLTTLGLTQWLQGRNQHLVKIFGELAETATAPEVREAFAAMSKQVVGHEKRLSKEYQRFEDL